MIRSSGFLKQLSMGKAKTRNNNNKLKDQVESSTNSNVMVKDIAQFKFLSIYSEYEAGLT